MNFIVREVIENIPKDSLIEFQKEIFKLEGKISGHCLFEMFIPFLDEMVTFYNNSHLLSLTAVSILISVVNLCMKPRKLLLNPQNLLRKVKLLALCLVLPNFPLVSHKTSKEVW